MLRNVPQHTAGVRIPGNLVSILNSLRIQILNAFKNLTFWCPTHQKTVTLVTCLVTVQAGTQAMACRTNIQHPET